MVYLPCREKAIDRFDFWDAFSIHSQKGCNVLTITYLWGILQVFMKLLGPTISSGHQRHQDKVTLRTVSKCVRSWIKV